MQENQSQETVSEERKKKTSEGAKTALKIIIGLIFIVVGLLSVIIWWDELLALIKGCVGLFFIMVGAITIAIAKE